jgi:hypothetical protein
MIVMIAIINFWCVIACGKVSGHTPRETYLALSFSRTNLTGQWDVALRDLQQGLGLDPIDVKAVSPEELSRRQEALALDTVTRLEVTADGVAVPLRVTDYLSVTLNSEEYARLEFAGGGLEAEPAVVEINARVLFAIDVAMHGVLRVEHRGGTETAVFNADHPSHQFKLREGGGRWRQWGTFVWEGVWHIWIGYDHILFLVALLLPSVLRPKGEGWASVDQFRPAIVNVLQIVTAFTIAHSVTLSLAALNLVRLPARPVEVVIAASVALAAANNLWPLVRGKGWMIAFGFGLIHGFGFANVLAELGLNSGTLARALVGFNVGVELGQLAIVAAFLPVAYALRGSRFYRTVTFKFGSAVVVLLAAAWMIERAFDVELMRF